VGVSVAVGTGIVVEVGTVVAVAGMAAAGLTAALHAVSAKITKSRHPFFIASPLIVKPL